MHRRTQQENLASRPQQKPNSKVGYFLEAAFQTPKTWEDKVQKKCLNLHNSTGKKMFICFPRFYPCENTSVTRRRPSRIKALQVVPTNEGQHHCNGFWQQCTSKQWTPHEDFSTSGFLSTCTSSTRHRDGWYVSNRRRARFWHVLLESKMKRTERWMICICSIIYLCIEMMQAMFVNKYKNISMYMYSKNLQPPTEL